MASDENDLQANERMLNRAGLVLIQGRWEVAQAGRNMGA